VQTLTIKAKSLESAQGFVTGLASFNAELRATDDGSYLVEIPLGGPDREIIAVLNALEDYVTNRSQERIEVALAGRTYELHPAGRPRAIAEALPA
jgi:hypothetical protein